MKTATTGYEVITDEYLPNFASFGRGILAARCVGERTIMGSDWPIIDKVEVFRPVTGRPEWIVTLGLCNGFPRDYQAFRTRREALEFYGDNAPPYRGYVRTDAGTVYVQLPDAHSEEGFVTTDGAQTWESEQGLGAHSWECIPESEVSDADRERLAWLLED